MDTSSDTKKKLKKKQLWLPDTLRGKKLQKSRFPSDKEADCEKYLEQYLDTGEIDLLHKALQIDSSLFQGVAYKIDLKAEEAKRKRSPNYKSAIDSIYIDRLVIVGEVIRSLQDKCVFRFGEVIKTPQGKRVYSVHRKVTEGAKRYLKRISPLLVPERKAYIEQDTKDGLIHVDPYQMKGGTSFIKYQSAEKFKEYWDSVKDAFKQTQSKNHYNEGDNKLKEDDAVKAIKKLGNKLYEDEAKDLDLSDIKTKTASYIRMVHENSCQQCNKKGPKGLSDKTLFRLLKKAEEEINEAD